MIVSSVLIIWKFLMCVTGSESAVVVVLSESMEPAFQRGDILFLRMGEDPIRAGEIVVFNIDKGSFNHGKRRMNNRTNMTQREDVIRRTVHVSDIDQQVTEEQLASLFINCGEVVDCRICDHPNSVLRFAFIEFTDEEGARNALSLAGTMLGFYPVRVMPSKTASAPVNPTFFPRVSLFYFAISENDFFY